jgi:uncharacterized protein
MNAIDLILNPAEQRLRAGWRMAIFIGAMISIDSALLSVISGLFTRAGLIRSALLTEFITYVVVFGVTWGMCVFIDRRPLRSVGFGVHERTLIELGQGLGLGALMMAVIFTVNVGSGLASFSFKELTVTEIASMSSWSIAEFTLVAFGEELLFRGYLFQTLAEGTSRVIAVLVFAVFFAFVHIGNPNATTFSLVNIAIAGVWLSAAYFKTRGLWLPMGLHFSWNFVQNHIFSFPVSGLSMSDKQLGVLHDNGPAWLTGGTFGPEGGALATVVLIAGTLVIWYAPQFRMSASAWTIDRAASPEASGIRATPALPQSDDAV